MRKIFPRMREKICDEDLRGAKRGWETCIQTGREMESFVEFPTPAHSTSDGMTRDVHDEIAQCGESWLVGCLGHDVGLHVLARAPRERVVRALDVGVDSCVVIDEK